MTSFDSSSQSQPGVVCAVCGATDPDDEDTAKLCRYPCAGGCIREIGALVWNGEAWVRKAVQS